MTDADETYVPTQQEIDDVLDLYDTWLGEEYYKHGSKKRAIKNATNRINESHSSKVFFWIADNDNSLIYDVDDTIVE